MLSNTIINQWGYLLRIFSSFDEFPVFASTEEGQPGRSPSFSVEFVVGKFFRIGKKSTKKFEENKVQLYPHFFITKNSVSWSFLGQIHIYCIEPVLPQIQNWRWETVRMLSAQQWFFALKTQWKAELCTVQTTKHKTLLELTCILGSPQVVSIIFYSFFSDILTSKCISFSVFTTAAH